MELSGISSWPVRSCPRSRMHATGMSRRAVVEMSSVVAAGRYNETLQTARDGSAQAPITIRGTTGAIVTAVGRTITIRHAYQVVEQVVFDGQYGDDAQATRITARIDHPGCRRLNFAAPARHALMTGVSSPRNASCSFITFPLSSGWPPKLQFMAETDA